MKPHQPHDKFFKSFFANKKHAIGLLSGVLPPSISEKCDLNTLSLDSTSYVDEHLKAHFADLVYTCKLKNSSRVYFSFLLEHKTTPASHPHLQLLRYFINIWEKEVKQRKALSVIIPIIIYHGRLNPLRITFLQTLVRTALTCSLTYHFSNTCSQTSLKRTKPLSGKPFSSRMYASPCC